MIPHPPSLPESGPGSGNHPEARVRGAAELLQTLWGEELPPSPEPWRTALLDALAADDAAGTSRGVVVQGDGLTLTALSALVRAAGREAPALPPALLQRARDVPSVHVVPTTATTTEADGTPCESLGLWEFDFATGTVMFDEACGRLLGEGPVAVGDRPLTAALTTSIHPDDQERVGVAMAAAAASREYEVVFRTRQPDGSWLSLRSRGSVVGPGPARLLGVLVRDTACLTAV
ncbi:PAS domain-containing protein [Kineococcus rubinsiae]|uniref:PAS domain-containing protein n=1 Tax=Kineococcus rubinsiae TaxID=2609562 RepID=UPI001431EC0F|nr:PAS domain-containing protein [Kineococcus rubinsiae]NIZ90971.1 PAS domain-containing protein [Kineococcus rubinsiae]